MRSYLQLFLMARTKQVVRRREPPKYELEVHKLSKKGTYSLEYLQKHSELDQAAFDALKVQACDISFTYIQDKYTPETDKPPGRATRREMAHTLVTTLRGTIAAAALDLTAGKGLNSLLQGILRNRVEYAIDRHFAGHSARLVPKDMSSSRSNPGNVEHDKDDSDSVEEIMPIPNSHKRPIAKVSTASVPSSKRQSMDFVANIQWNGQEEEGPSPEIPMRKRVQTNEIRVNAAEPTPQPAAETSNELETTNNHIQSNLKQSHDQLQHGAFAFWVLAHQRDTLAVASGHKASHSFKLDTSHSFQDLTSHLRKSVAFNSSTHALTVYVNLGLPNRLLTPMSIENEELWDIAKEAIQEAKQARVVIEIDSK